ncbi:hypothetical protein PoB_005128300 [Plakobranchus ocellatus]|uniref:Uncharacterized protein n=1 Tax=Plakobranchus ocellatus TaxID=259542 RepID=A0AAV4C112_9GAST|nr:hypothetical protein PoB_005128300 [Plakobranchus ocellatus]
MAKGAGSLGRSKENQPTLSPLEELWCRQHIPGGKKRHKSSQGDLRLSGPPSGRGTSGRVQTCNRRVHADVRADLLSTVPPAPRVSKIEKGTEGKE